MNSRYEDIISNLIKYGETSERIKAEVLIGSLSRQSNCADEYSDIDVILFVRGTEHFNNLIEYVLYFLKLMFEEIFNSGCDFLN